MNARRDSTDGPENVDELFAEIVAGLERDGVGKDWLDLDEASPESLLMRFFVRPDSLGDLVDAARMVTDQPLPAGRRLAVDAKLRPAPAGAELDPMLRALRPADISREETPS